MTKTRQQIADEYSINPRTLVRRLQNLGIRLPSGILTPAWCDKIYRTLGHPDPAVYSNGLPDLLAPDDLPVENPADDDDAEQKGA